MPTVEFITEEFQELVGKELPLGELSEKLSMLGTAVEELDEEKMCVEVFPNRPDMLSIEGMARAFRAFLGLEGRKEYKVEKSPFEIKISPNVAKVRPYIASAVVKNVRMDDDLLVSLIAIQEALHKTHGRKRNKVAIGIHDLDKLTPGFEYKAVKPEDVKFRPLDYPNETWDLQQILDKHPKGKDYAWTLEGKDVYPLVCDKEGVVSFPPIINADRTKLSSQTINIFIEITGTNKHAVNLALNIITTSIAERSGQIMSVKVGKEDTPDLQPRKINVSVNYINHLLGTKLKTEELKTLLSKMGHGVGKVTETSIEVLAPAYRTDVLHPIDIVEDIAISYGYDNFKEEPTDISTVGAPDEFEDYCDGLRDILTGLGFQETVSFVLTKQETLDSSGEKARPALIKNPRTSDFTLIRPSLMPCLLENLAYNKTRKLPQRLFELDDVVESRDKHENKRKLALCITDNNVNFSMVQSVCEALLKDADIEYELKEDVSEKFIDGRCAAIIIKGKKTGIFGEVHPKVLNAFGIEYPVVMMEMDVNP